MHYTTTQTFLLIEPGAPQQKVGQLRECKVSIPATQGEMCTLDVHERHKYDFCSIPHYSVRVINLFQYKSIGIEINYCILVDIETHTENTPLLSAK